VVGRRAVGGRDSTEVRAAADCLGPISAKHPSIDIGHGDLHCILLSAYL